MTDAEGSLSIQDFWAARPSGAVSPKDAEAVREVVRGLLLLAPPPEAHHARRPGPRRDSACWHPERGRGRNAGPRARPGRGQGQAGPRKRGACRARPDHAEPTLKGCLNRLSSRTVPRVAELILALKEAPDGAALADAVFGASARDPSMTADHSTLLQTLCRHSQEYRAAVIARCEAFLAAAQGGIAASRSVDPSADYEGFCEAAARKRRTIGESSLVAELCRRNVAPLAASLTRTLGDALAWVMRLEDSDEAEASADTAVECVAAVCRSLGEPARQHFLRAVRVAGGIAKLPGSRPKCRMRDVLEARPQRARV